MPSRRLIFLAYKVLETLEAFSSCGAHWEVQTREMSTSGRIVVVVDVYVCSIWLALTWNVVTFDGKISGKRELQLRDSSGESIAPAPSAAPEEGEEASAEIPPSDEQAAPSEASEEEKPEEDIREVDVPRSAAELLAANHKAVLLRARHRVLEQLLSLLSTMVMEEAEDHELVSNRGSAPQPEPYACLFAHPQEQFGRHLTQAMTPCKLSLVFNKFIAGELAQVATGEAEDVSAAHFLSTDLRVAGLHRVSTATSLGERNPISSCL
ncbi:MAG: hypothetical protein SGPRY_001719 [Prymnesium sp.]